MSQNTEILEEMDVQEYSDDDIPDFIKSSAQAAQAAQVAQVAQAAPVAASTTTSRAEEGQAASVTSQRSLGAVSQRVLPASDLHPEAAMNRLEAAYMDVTGECMSAETRANIYAFMQKFSIRPHDAIMCLLIANGHLDNRMQKLPHQFATVLEKGARDVLDSCEKASADEAKRASTKLLQQVSDKIEEHQSGGKWQHIAYASPIFLIGLLLGNMLPKMSISIKLVRLLF